MPRRFVVIVAFGLALASCQGVDRPSASEWQPRWDRVLTEIPSLEALSGADPKSLCGRALSVVREERLSLLPAPEPTLDAPVGDWLDVADETFFECPPRSGEIQGFEVAYQLLDDYQREVAAVLGE